MAFYRLQVHSPFNTKLFLMPTLCQTLFWGSRTPPPYYTYTPSICWYMKGQTSHNAAVPVNIRSDQIRSDQSLSHVRLFSTPWIAARQASLSITNSWSSLRLTSIESVMPSSHLILCHPLLLPPIPPSIRVFSNESTLHMRWPKYGSFSFSIIPSKEIPGLISFRADVKKNEINWQLATHSSTLAWKIPWAEEPGMLHSMGSLRVGHDWATSLSLFTFMHWRRKWQPTPVFLPWESQGRGSLVGCRLWRRTESDMTEAT